MWDSYSQRKHQKHTNCKYRGNISTGIFVCVFMYSDIEDVMSYLRLVCDWGWKTLQSSKCQTNYTSLTESDFLISLLWNILYTTSVTFSVPLPLFVCPPLVTVTGLWLTSTVKVDKTYRCCCHFYSRWRNFYSLWRNLHGYTQDSACKFHHRL